MYVNKYKARVVVKVTGSAFYFKGLGDALEGAYEFHLHSRIGCTGHFLGLDPLSETMSTPRLAPLHVLSTKCFSTGTGESTIAAQLLGFWSAVLGRDHQPNACCNHVLYRPKITQGKRKW